ncbi:MAG: hypothetical protein IPL46_30250 [Saprospiraceae bacterium]|nr:hypothetical protein [Saprospiraceae bacterium]
MKNLYLLLTILPTLLSAQERPGIFFREEFKETPAEIPVTQNHIASPDLLITLHGPGADVIKKSHHDKPADDPFYIWSGLCEGNWAVSLKHRSQNVDLSRAAKIRWRSKQSGYRQLRLILKLSDGTWLVSDQYDGDSKDWRVYEFNISDIRWMTLNIETILEMKPIENPDLSNVVELGWTDLMRGGGSDASSRLDWIEVDGFSVAR